MREEVLLAAHGLVRHYGRHAALRGIDLSLAPGTVLGFLGLNGAGKSTALQVLAGALAADAGEIRICGHDLTRAPRAARAALGYLPQVPALYDELAVDDCLACAARLHGVPAAAVADAVARARGRTGLNEVGGRPVAQLSEGYRQRLGLAQAIVHEPRVLLLDEPTAALDPAQSRETRALIRELGHARAIVVSTHILSEVQAIANRVAILHEGRIVHDAPLGSGNVWVRARFVHAPPATALGGLAGIDTVSREDDGAWLLGCADGTAVASRLAAHAVQAGWGLVELVPAYDALEQLFLRLTTGTTP